MAAPGLALPANEPAARVEDAGKALGLSRPAARRPAKDFKLTLIDGAAFRLADQRGKALILNFWATWCAPCVEEMPTLERLWRAHRDRGLALLAVSIDVKGTNLSRFLKDHKLALPVGADPQSAVASAFSVRSLPTTIVLDVEGRIVAVALGPRAWDGPAARALVGALLAERR
jgi:peroxiredoxin